jgi:hypothetical protein
MLAVYALIWVISAFAVLPSACAPRMKPGWRRPRPCHQRAGQFPAAPGGLARHGRLWPSLRCSTPISRGLDHGSDLDISPLIGL